MTEREDRDTGRDAQSPWLRLVTLVGGLVIVGSVVFIGLRAGQALFGAGAIEALGGELHQVQTTGPTYVGRITAVRGGYVLLADPAIVTAQPTSEGEAAEYRVESLISEPYGIDGAIAIREEQIVHAGSVSSDSGLAGAYQAVATGQPEPDEDP